MKKVIFYVIIPIIMVWGMVYTCSSMIRVNNIDKGDVSIEDTSDILTKNVIPEESEAPQTSWEYRESVDEMDDSVSKFWTLTSISPVSLEWPYGEQYVYITVRHTKKWGWDVFIHLDKANINGSKYDNTNYIYARFDGQTKTKWYFSESSSGRSNTIFIDKTKKFISKLKTSKTLLIEIPFYEDGRKIAKFVINEPLSIEEPLNST